MNKFHNLIKKELKDYKLLFRNIPSLTITLFFISVVCANLMANKELFNYKYVALVAVLYSAGSCFFAWT